MLVHATKPLFPWDELEVSPTLGTIKDALQAIPDSALLNALRQPHPKRQLCGRMTQRHRKMHKPGHSATLTGAPPQ